MDTQVQIIKQVNYQDVMDSRDVAKMVGKTLGKAETILALALSEVHKEFSNKKIGDSND